MGTVPTEVKLGDSYFNAQIVNEYPIVNECAVYVL